MGEKPGWEGGAAAAMRGRRIQWTGRGAAGSQIREGGLVQRQAAPSGALEGLAHVLSGEIHRIHADLHDLCYGRVHVLCL